MIQAQVYIATFFAALLGVIPPGLINMSVAKTCLKKGKQQGVLMAFGASIVVFIQAIVAVLLSSYIFNHPYVKSMLMRTGLVILFILMLYFFFTAKFKKTDKVEVKSNSKSFTSFLNGIGIAVLNIFPIPYFVVLSTVFGSEFQFKFTAVSIIMFSFCAALGTFVSLYLYVVFFLKIEHKVKTFKQYSNYFMAALMLVLACVTLWRIYYKT
ncbi:LysE family translocator [Psychroflexus sp. ALD_RP9]|uniref:LysE family translocator n=1 Tax=Psychroflexus sp. ALD_RP9 TaxID=2777186 RepID=UPI001A8D3580|nr:LysE family transporter [Psychroflexus sp. ALD_RP9]QSS96192.1 LysE family transporter [Psychroflexus sp. ALD_RP9]